LELPIPFPLFFSLPTQLVFSFENLLNSMNDLINDGDIVIQIEKMKDNLKVLKFFLFGGSDLNFKANFFKLTELLR